MKNIYLIFFFFLLAPFVFCQTQEGDISLLLGGMVKSDRWVIRKDVFEEEFIGNVRYENDVYKILADRALSKRKTKEYELSGNVFLSRIEGETYLSLTADKVFYNQRKDLGFAKGSKKAQVKIIYLTPDNIYTLIADKVEFSKKASFFEVSGNVQLSDKENTLKAESATFDRINGIFEALKVRPVLIGKNKDGSYALQADKITVNTNTQEFKALGNSQGWITLEKDLLTKENLKKLKD